MKEIDCEGARRILEAISDHGFKEPDAEMLARGVNLCGRWYREATELSLRNEKIVSAAIKSTKRLRQQLKDMPFQHSHVDALNRMLHDLDPQIGKEQRRMEKAYRANLMMRSPFEWIAGQYLADLYIFMFERKPTYTPSGPYVKFAEAALQELQISKQGSHYSVQSIAKAHKDIVSAKTRRSQNSKYSEPFRIWRAALIFKVCFGHSIFGRDIEPVERFEYFQIGQNGPK